MKELVGVSCWAREPETRRGIAVIGWRVGGVLRSDKDTVVANWPEKPSLERALPVPVNM